MLTPPAPVKPVICLSDPHYNLKGAARPAREFYKDPNQVETPDPIDLLEMYSGHMWDHEEGQVLLDCMMKLGLAQHNIAKKPKAAIQTFEEMITLDPFDHTVSFKIASQYLVNIVNSLFFRSRGLDTNFFVATWIWPWVGRQDAYWTSLVMTTRAASRTVELSSNISHWAWARGMRPPSSETPHY